jgi:hypothetical protein
VRHESGSNMLDRKSYLIAIAALGVVAAVSIGATVTLIATRGDSSGHSSPSAAANSSATDGAATNAGLASNVEAQGQSAGVFINEKEISKEQVDALKQMYGASPPAGRYWYDPRSGLYGYSGREAAGYIRPGHDFGTLSARASNGNTGVFLNGREINLTEAQFFQRVFGVVYQGRFWLDGATGNLGVEGNPMPLANLVAAMQRAQGSGDGGYRWRDGSGATITSEGNCTFAAIPGAPVYSTPGCG